MPRISVEMREQDVTAEDILLTMTMSEGKPSPWSGNAMHPERHDGSVLDATAAASGSRFELLGMASRERHGIDTRKDLIEVAVRALNSPLGKMVRERVRDQRRYLHSVQKLVFNLPATRAGVSPSLVAEFKTGEHVGPSAARNHLLIFVVDTQGQYSIVTQFGKSDEPENRGTIAGEKDCCHIDDKFTNRDATMRQLLYIQEDGKVDVVAIGGTTLRPGQDAIFRGA